LRNGVRYCGSTKLENRKAAENYEAGRIVQVANGEVGLIDRPRYTIAELLDGLKGNWKLNHKDSVQNLSLLKQVRKDFSGLADELTAEDLRRYAVRRQKAGYANASTNRHLECLRRAYRLAGLTPPKIERLSEDNRRSGFFSAQQMERVLSHLPDDGLSDYVRFAWVTGMRKSEAASLRWSFIHDGQIIIPPEFCKSRKAHVIPLSGPLVPIIERRKVARPFKSNGTMQLCEFIFHRSGEPVREFRKAWKSACTKAGCGNYLFHDLRRSAVRDMIRSGVPQSVAMKLTGHRTISVFNRYDITATEDVSRALEQTAKFRSA
jgi:integrase